MLNNTNEWSHTRGNAVVPSRWQATARTFNPLHGNHGDVETDAHPATTGPTFMPENVKSGPARNQIPTGPATRPS